MDKLELLCVAFIIAGVTSGDMFSAIADLEGILKVEQEVADDLRAYVANEEIRLSKLRR